MGWGGVTTDYQVSLGGLHSSLCCIVIRGLRGEGIGVRGLSPAGEGRREGRTGRSVRARGDDPLLIMPFSSVCSETAHRRKGETIRTTHRSQSESYRYPDGHMTSEQQQSLHKAPRQQLQQRLQQLIVP